MCRALARPFIQNAVYLRYGRWRRVKRYPEPEELMDV